MSAVSLRRATEADVRTIVEMLADDPLGAAREDLSEPLAAGYLDAFGAIDADPNQLLAVAERDGEIIGTLQLTFIAGLSRKGALRGQIEAVRVAAPARGIGLGSQMIDWAVEECRARGCATVQLTSDASRTDAHRFYERLGFKASHLGFKRTL
ncbi:GNAT family N-acetyltransferase [Yangia mangrovi]|uniref:GNAT family N-acetyltransferase n=1 Tax=Alloyangia mangrovi TaxID=1779329 RepID=A0A2A3JT57_9RHOB|nr:GNAT family N-acetyltransferase [Alloyangia mangrovi]MCA0941534.1 GNAT family N-acetyltransferase [Alloyangia pacifica]MCA0946416.1 GNAT family N-acetyltransferase [Alloyangia pacifica]MCT4372927.1 GNAT family N-acetyltransferase [Alloyangia mangrovi]